MPALQYSGWEGGWKSQALLSQGFGHTQELVSWCLGSSFHNEPWDELIRQRSLLGERWGCSCRAAGIPLPCPTRSSRQGCFISPGSWHCECWKGRPGSEPSQCRLRSQPVAHLLPVPADNYLPKRCLLRPASSTAWLERSWLQEIYGFPSTCITKTTFTVSLEQVLKHRE